MKKMNVKYLEAPVTTQTLCSFTCLNPLDCVRYPPAAAAGCSNTLLDLLKMEEDALLVIQGTGLKVVSISLII